MFYLLSTLGSSFSYIRHKKDEFKVIWDRAETGIYQTRQLKGSYKKTEKRDKDSVNIITTRIMPYEGKHLVDGSSQCWALKKQLLFSISKEQYLRLTSMLVFM